MDTVQMRSLLIFDVPFISILINRPLCVYTLLIIVKCTQHRKVLDPSWVCRTNTVQLEHTLGLLCLLSQGILVSTAAACQANYQTRVPGNGEEEGVVACVNK